MVVFNEAMEMYLEYEFDESMAFERAAGKGVEDAIFVQYLTESMSKEDCAEMEDPLGYLCAGVLSEEDSRERFDFMKKSAEGGCSWGQVEYGRYFEQGQFVERDKQVWVEWLQKAVSQNNPSAMDELGEWFREKGEDEVALSWYCKAAELGWKKSMLPLAQMFRTGEGCAGEDLRQALAWYARGGAVDDFLEVLDDVRVTIIEDFDNGYDCDFDQLCYSLGWGLYWHVHGTIEWDDLEEENEDFGNRCFDYYCNCVTLQQESIFVFLCFWNRTFKGFKEIGTKIVEDHVWNGRHNWPVERFDDRQDEPETKRRTL
jgi:TPR repeat protein